ncbi:MAG: cell division protein ZipA C-terminal FtsZ-binding domain-containing protein [Nevskiales bacterium]|nr:cell division protein ZipA C-terminal FtsZ-binding domain-containing protein [Nevskiales bacterium]
MTPLQWALLVVGAAAVIAIYLYSRREQGGPRKRARKAPESVGGGASPQTLPGADQMDMFSRFGEFDEFGVGKPRKRVAPLMPGQQPPDAAEPATTATGAGGDTAPAPSQDAPQAQIQQRLVTVLIAEREGTAILGPKIHAALRARGLSFGEHRIYHRIELGQPVYSVASLVKPGVLDPDQAPQFSTPGLSMFMMLPGPKHPVDALTDMLSTARALAAELNAEVYDANRQLLSAEAEQGLAQDIAGWAQQHGL